MRYHIKKPSYLNYHSSLDCLFYKHPENYGRLFTREFRTLKVEEIRTMSNILWLLEIHLHEYTEKIWATNEYINFLDGCDAKKIGKSSLELIFLDFTYVNGYVINKFGENRLMELILQVIVTNLEKREGNDQLYRELSLKKIFEERLDSNQRLLSSINTTNPQLKMEMETLMFERLVEHPLELSKTVNRDALIKGFSANMQQYLKQQRKEGIAIAPEEIATEFIEQVLDSTKNMVFNVLRNEIT